MFMTVVFRYLERFCEVRDASREVQLSAHSPVRLHDVCVSLALVRFMLDLTGWNVFGEFCC